MKRYSFLPLALSILLLTGCSLARAEDTGAAGQEDRWVGVYVVSEKSRDLFYDNPNLTEYGSNTLDTGKYGNIVVSRKVLMAEHDGTNYRFPGMEGGYSLFRVRREEDYGPVTEMVSNMGPADTSSSVNYSDAGTEEYLSGTIYEGPPEGVQDWDPIDYHTIWTAYRVFQTPEGQVYLDGTGNGYGGGGSSFTETRTYNYASDGEAVKEDKLTVKVTFQVVPRLEKLTVTQFGADNAPIRSDELALREDMPELVCEPDAVWVLVEEVSTDGAVHTAYDLPAEDGDPVSHMVVLLDEDGMGTAVQLEIKAAGAA